MAQDSDAQKDQDLEELYQRTFNNESINKMAATERVKVTEINNNESKNKRILPENIAKFQLFTRSNRVDAYNLELDNSENLKGSLFSSERKTKVIIHGWLSTASESWIKAMTANYLSVGDYNIITVDWSILSMQDYLSARLSTYLVSKRIAKLLKYLENAVNLSFGNVHLVGHSLGAHIAGFAGAQVNGALDRITGMDPAGPLFEMPELKPAYARLDYTDAKFVDVIHTCAGIVGFYAAIGDVDFYPNGGMCNQPGCRLALTCSHGRSHDYMADSIIYPDGFYSEKCSSSSNCNNGYCQDIASAIMGESIDSNSHGVYYLNTNSKSPYGKGKNKKPKSRTDHATCLITLMTLKNY